MPNPTRLVAQKAAKKKLEKLERQALGWGGFDDTLKPQQVGLGRGRRQGAVRAVGAACSAALEPQRARRRGPAAALRRRGRAAGLPASWPTPHRLTGGITGRRSR